MAAVEDEHMSSSSSSEENEEEMEESSADGVNGTKTPSVYLPKSTDDADELEYEPDAYVMYHQAQAGIPCLSFDVVKDNLGNDRTDFPMTAYLVAGTQAERSHLNNLMVMKMSNLSKVKHKTKDTDDDDDDDDSSSSEDEDEEVPDLQCAQIKHNGCVNRIRVTNVGEVTLAASWSESGKVSIWNLERPLQAVNDEEDLKSYVKNLEAPKPLFTFGGHLNEGFALDWSTTMPGYLATGDCTKNIHIWKMQDGGTWHVDQRPYVAHTDSVEDIQWSPNEPYVFASCSVDKSIRIWDSRAQQSKACMLTAANAHESDVNVISWNQKDPFILSGGDEGVIKVWDLRQFQTSQPSAVFKHHMAPITSVEWNPNDGSSFAASGADNQLTLWDLAVEKDALDNNEDPELAELPPQLLFIHQGQKDVKELHWHSQLTGVIISTAASGFDIFRSISV